MTRPLSLRKPQTTTGMQTRNDWHHHFMTLCRAKLQKKGEMCEIILKKSLWLFHQNFIYKLKYRVFMMESTKSKQLLWDFLLKDHMVSWANLIGIKRPFCETKSDFWYSEKKISVHFGDISKGYPLEKCQNHHLLFEKLFHISKWPIKAFLKINFNLTLLYEKCPKYGSRCGQ